MVAPAITEVAGTRIHTRPVGGLPLMYVDSPSYDGGKKTAKTKKEQQPRSNPAANKSAPRPTYTKLPPKSSAQSKTVAPRQNSRPPPAPTALHRGYTTASP